MELAGKSLFSKPLRSLNQTNGRVPKQGGSNCFRNPCGKALLPPCPRSSRLCQPLCCSLEWNRVEVLRRRRCLGVGGIDCAKGMPTCHLGVTRRELIQGSKVVLDQGRVERMGIEEGGNRRALPSDLAAEMGLEVLLELVLVIGDGSRVDS